MTDYSKLRELAEKATPGKWRTDGPRVCDGNCGKPFVYRDGGDKTASYTEYHGGCLTVALAELGDATSDAAFIAACDPQTVIGLLDQLAAMTAARDEACAGWDRERDNEGYGPSQRSIDLRKVGH